MTSLPSNSNDDQSVTSHSSELVVRLPPRNQISTTSFQESFAVFWTNDEFHDLTLEGSDGYCVQVNRMALAARSEVFRRMLLGGFRESSSNKVPFSYKGNIVEAIVEYLHTDTVSLLHLEEDNENDTTKQVARAQDLTCLVGAAHFFDLPALCYKALDGLDHLLRQQPELSVHVLDLCSTMALPHELRAVALPRLRNGSVDFHNANHVGILSASVMEEILRDDLTSWNEFELFQILQLWADYDGDDDSTTDWEEPNKRQAEAARLAHHLRLEKIHPTHLSTTVSSSGFVSSEQLLQAYQSQALALSTDISEKDFQCPRLNPLWKSSVSKEVEYSGGCCWMNDALNCTPIVSGTYQWSITIFKHTNIVLGVAIQPNELHRNAYCGSYDNSWGYHHNGNTNGSNSVYPRRQRWSVGSTVTFTLDLNSDNEHHGSLSASIDDGEPLLLFTHLEEALQSNINSGNNPDEKRGFIPVASLYGGPNHIRLVDFKNI